MTTHLLPQAVEVEIKAGSYRTVRNVTGLTELLLAESWPKQRGPAYFAALRACLNCLSDQCEAKIAHAAFLKAAKDAGVFIRPNGRR
jgi:hypothetical protein